MPQTSWTSSQAPAFPWKAYLEDYPAHCFTGATSGGYAKKHNPFIYYDDVAHNPARCKPPRWLRRLSADLLAGRLPTFVWIAPNLCDDTHDCGVATGDRFLRAPSLCHNMPCGSQEFEARAPHAFSLQCLREALRNGPN